MATSEALNSIEQQLTEAAELQLTGTITEELYVSMVRGAIAVLPTPAAPSHIPVLKRLQQWKRDKLIPPDVHDRVQSIVMAAAKQPTVAAGPSGPKVASPAVAPPVTAAKAKLPTKLETAKPAKKAKVEPVQTTTLFSLLPDAKKIKIAANELRLQREASARGEIYVPEEDDVRTFKSERQDAPAPPVLKEFCCEQCPRTFSTLTGLRNHTKWHSVEAKPKLFSPQQPVALPFKIGLRFTVLDGELDVGITLDGRDRKEVQEEIAAGLAAQQERQRQRDEEAHRRQRIRDAEAEADRGEHRCGSKRRGSYTAKEKLRILDIFDQIRADTNVLKKVETFNNDLRCKGTPYTTVLVHWHPPLERAQISAAAGREHALIHCCGSTQWIARRESSMTWRPCSSPDSRHGVHADARCLVAG